MIPAKVGWAVGAWRLPQVLRLLRHPSRGCLLGQHSSSPALPRALGTISHTVPISTCPCYQREEAGITGKNLDFVGIELCFVRGHPAVENMSEKAQGGAVLLLQGNASSEPCFGHPNTQAKMQSWTKLLPLVVG